MSKGIFNLNEYDDVKYITSLSIEETGMVKHFFSTRVGGKSEGIYEGLNLGVFTNDNFEKVDYNFKKIFNAVDMSVEKKVFLKQIHSGEFYVVDEKNYKEILGHEGDAIITSEPGIAIGVFTADCVPIILLDKSKKIVSVIHAGWKGTYNGIVKRVLNFMVKSLDSDLNCVLAAIGPSIGSCCFEVGIDVADKFKFVYLRDGKYFVDLWAENIEQMKDIGISESNIASSELCTFCNKKLFYSYRRDNGKTGRMATFIELI